MIEYPNCKINIGLGVMRRRDDGYHDLESVFVPVPLCDELEINPSARFSFMQSGINVGCYPEDNIVVKAFNLMRKECGTRLPDVEIHLHKRIPFGAGLGGGSSDAAFTLRMLNSLFDLGIDGQRLRELAAKLGADCSFFIDNQPALVTGIGDCITPLGYNPLQGSTLLMVKPDEAVSTAEAYRGVTPRDRRTDAKPVDLAEALRLPPEQWRDLVVNDFEASVFQSHPRLAELKAQMYAAGAAYAAMSGSGSTVYGLFPHTVASPEKHFNKNDVLFISEI